MSSPPSPRARPERPLLLIGSIPAEVGWSSIHHMLALASSCFGTPLVNLQQQPFPSMTRRLLGSLPPHRTRDPDGPVCLLIGAAPGDLARVFDVAGWRTRFSSIVAWVIDSYWTEWIPRSIRAARPFDRIYISSGEDVPAWRAAVGDSVSWLPWATDVVGLGSAQPQRDLDLTRIGRQPPEWDDDAATASAAALAGLTFQPRPPAPPSTTLDNHRALMAIFARSKFTLSFSNLSHRSPHTHPTRDYITGRWVDAIASGALVAGVAPRGDCIDQLFWPGATLELGGTGRDEGLRSIADAVRTWTPEVAARQHAMALRRLDWRHRFATLADALGVHFDSLSREIALLDKRIAETARHTAGMDDREATCPPAQ